ncbi:HigA family addiction module antitoxin [Salinicola peritrichatus]|uniref:HigA family addiction module antitoxin n=1 Tax=Salinicola peritrichatus TaxID=1267424 RepID=UPI0023B79720|nr:HigA family addiction module antitoxin [Salinicola peritrichatus]
MFNPCHPGEILREEVINALGLSVTEAARRLKITRANLSRILNEHASISPDLAVRLERAGVGRAEHWLRMQVQYDVWVAQHRDQPEVEPLAEVS